MAKKRKKVGLVLSSGAIRGLAHVGVIKELVKAGIPIDYIAGTSIGAWVGACFASNQNTETLEDQTLGYRKKKFLAFLEPTLKGGLVKGKKMQKLLIEFLGDITFEDLHVPLTVVATDMIASSAYYMKQGPLIPALRASMSIPILFQPVEMNGTLLLDGGLTNPLPVQAVRDMGADIVIAVNVEERPIDLAVSKKDLKSVTFTGKHAFDIVRYHLVEHSREEADILIEPRFPVRGGIQNWKDYFLEGKDKEYMSAGARAVTPLIPKIQALLEGKK